MICHRNIFQIITKEEHKKIKKLKFIKIKIVMQILNKT